VVSYEGARYVDTLALHVWPGAAASVTSALYEDAGDGYGYERGQFRRTTFTTSGGAARALDVALARTGTWNGARTFVVTLHAAPRPGSVRADGRAVTVRYDEAQRTATFAVSSGVTRISVTP
jgi:hypothetical protein